MDSSKLNLTRGHVAASVLLLVACISASYVKVERERLNERIKTERGIKNDVAVIALTSKLF